MPCWSSKCIRPSEGRPVCKGASVQGCGQTGAQRHRSRAHGVTPQSRICLRRLPGHSQRGQGAPLRASTIGTFSSRADVVATSVACALCGSVALCRLCADLSREQAREKILPHFEEAVARDVRAPPINQAVSRFLPPCIFAAAPETADCFAWFRLGSQPGSC
jgi:hypothetical protein